MMIENYFVLHDLRSKIQNVPDICHTLNACFGASDFFTSFKLSIFIIWKFYSKCINQIFSEQYIICNWADYIVS